MRSLLLSVLMFVMCLGVFAQPAVRYGDGHIKKNHKKAAVDKKQRKFNKAMNYVVSRKISSSELIELCSTFKNEVKRYKIARKAYKNVKDKGNYFKVYDLFTRMSLAIKLYHNTQAKDMINRKIKQNNEEVILHDDRDQEHMEDPVNPDMFDVDNNYPVTNTVSDREYMHHVKMVSAIGFNSEKLETIKKLIDKHNYTPDQIAGLVEKLNMDVDRLKALKFAAKYIHSSEERYAMSRLLRYRAYMKEYNDYLLNMK